MGDDQDREVYAGMVRIRIRLPLAHACAQMVASYKSEAVGEKSWNAMVDDASGQIVRDVIEPLAAERDRERERADREHENSKRAHRRWARLAQGVRREHSKSAYDGLCITCPRHQTRQWPCPTAALLDSDGDSPP